MPQTNQTDPAPLPETTGISAGATDSRKLTPKEQRLVRRTGVKARRRRRRLATLAIVLLVVLLAAVPGYRLLYQPYRAASFYKSLKNLYGQHGQGSLPEQYNEELGALYDLNDELTGWLVVPGSDLSLPVVSPVKHDSVYYVNHLFDGSANPCGTPYLLQAVDPAVSRTNTVIHGGEALFGSLTGYRSLDFYKNAPLLFLDTLQDAYIYKVFAVAPCDDTDVTEFSQGQFATPTAFYNFVASMADRSLIDTGITVEQDDRLLTLLCDGKEGRLAVVARALREGEDYTVDVSIARLRAPGDPPPAVALWTPTATSVTPTAPAATSQP